MEDLFDFLVAFAAEAWEYIVAVFEIIIKPILISWFNDVVDYFLSLALQEGVHVPFIMNTNPDINNPLSGLISEELKGEGVIEGVYNSQTDKLEKLRYVGGNGMDSQTNEIVNANPLTVLA